MESMSVMINLFGAVALLLFGLSQVTNGVSQAFGSVLRRVLATGTRNGVRSLVTGFAATLTLQSSTATALMTASFVERDLINPRMAQVLLLGANIGTATTAWVVSRGIEFLSPLLVVSGFLLFRRGSQARRAGGAALVGLGLMLLSLHLLQMATAPIRDAPALAAFLQLLDGAWPVALVFSALLAFLASSSLAAIMLILTLTSAGGLSGGLTVVMVLGANLGGALPPVMATIGSSVVARRLMLGNLAVRCFGCMLFLPVANGIAGVLAQWPFFSPAMLAVETHLAFNIIIATLAFPFNGQLASCLARCIPDQPEPETGTRFLIKDGLTNPSVALASASREVLGVGDVVEQMLLRIAEAFRRNDTAALTDISVLETQVDQLQEAVKLYVSRLAGAGLDKANTRRSADIIDYVINLEHIGDIIDKGLVPQLRKKISRGLAFSEEGASELSSLIDLTIANLCIAQTIFATGDAALAKELMRIKVEVRHRERISAERHLERLRAGRADSLQTSALHLDILRDLKRINAHLVSVAHPILDSSGLLIESRLRQA